MIKKLRMTILCQAMGLSFGLAFPLRLAWSATVLDSSEKTIHTAKSATPTLYENEATPREVGMAGWYGRSHQGKKTASGHYFDHADLTAAHPTYAFNSLVKVTNPKSGRSVVVRITDRGPYVKGRIIDLSEQAARQVGIRHRGVGRLIVQQVRPITAQI